MNSARALLFVLLSVFFFACVSGVDYGAEDTTINLQELVKIRCSLHQSDETVFFFNGTVTAFPTQQPNRVLFKTIGLNIARCFKRSDGSYTLAGRELLYYVDPVTDQIINRWTNPWTNETVPVVHVANDPVIQNFALGSTYPALKLDTNTLLPLDVPLYYPNALSFDPRMAPYSPQPFYQAGEWFKFISRTGEVRFPLTKTVTSTLVSWTRNGPWLPWMKQGNAPGYLIYSSHGNKVDSWRDFPASVRADLARIPHYKSAPDCVPAVRQVTSWSYFQANFAAYLSGDLFPLAAPAVYNCTAL
jgi:hypothetical protein